MLIFQFKLSGSCMRDFNTEIRFNIASARFENADLVKISLPKREESRENDRLLSCLTRILGSLKKEGVIQFYLSPRDFKNMTTEAQYVMNKFADHITLSESMNYFYVKM